MTENQTAINSRALIAAADKLTRTGWDGDAYRFVESLVLSVLADGYRRIEPPPPLRPTNPGTDTHRRQVLAETAAHLAAQRRNRQGENR